MTLLREKYTNGIATTLAEALDASETGIDVTDASSWPTSGFRVKVENEIMYVTSVASNTLTVIRGYEGTTAATHANGLSINHVITAQALDRIRLGILSACGIAPYVESLSTDDDNFDDENFSGWTFVGSTPSITQSIEQDHKFSIILPESSANAQYYAWMKNKTVPTNGWVQAGFQFSDSGGQYPIPAVIMANGSTWNAGKQLVWGFSPHETQYFLRDMTGYNAHVNASGYGTINECPKSTLHLRLEFVSNDHYSGYVSFDGLLWAKVFNNLSYGSIGAAPTWLGFGFTTWGAAREFHFGCTYCRFSF